MNALEYWRIDGNYCLMSNQLGLQRYAVLPKVTKDLAKKCIFGFVKSSKTHCGGNKFALRCDYSCTVDEIYFDCGAFFEGFCVTLQGGLKA